MIIITPTVEDKVLSFMPRDTEINYIILTDEETNVSTQIDLISAVTTSTHVNLTIPSGQFTFEDSHRYVLKAYSLLDEIIYYGLIYCTSKTIGNNVILDLNEGKYTNNVTENKYTIYE